MTKYIVWRVFYGVVRDERVVLAREYVATCTGPAKAEALRRATTRTSRNIFGEVETVAVAASIAGLDAEIGVAA